MVIVINGFYTIKTSKCLQLINCELGYQTVVIDELRVLPEVVEAHEVYGSIYDIIVKVTAKDEAKLKEVIRNDVRTIEKVRSTQTMTVV